MAVEDKIFIPYIERKVSKPFSNLKPDEQIIAHWALVYKELIKFNYSSLIGCDLDSPMTEKQMKGLSSDKKGGIMWYNYMYSDAYKEDEKLKKDKIEVGGKDPNYWARLSIFEALERFAVTAIGDFICTPQILNYIKEMRKTDRGIPNSNICRDEKKYEKCKEACEALVRHEKQLAGHPVMCLAGAFWTECGWKFDNVVNTWEAGGSGVNGTGGYTGCGESWFGITFWGQKKQIINGMGLPCPTSEGAYKPGNMIADLPFEKQAEICVWYLKNMVPKFGNVLLEFNKNRSKYSPEDCVAAAFLFKAGCWKQNGTLWERALDAKDHYWNGKAKPGYEGWALAIYHSMMFARYMKDKKVPTGDPWDK